MSSCSRAYRRYTEAEYPAFDEKVEGFNGLFDRFGKFARYRSIPSLQQYIMLDSRRPQVEVLTRQTSDAWLYETLALPADMVRLAASECTLMLAELYEGLLPLPIEAEHR